MELGVPADAVLVEPAATNTGENITLSRQLLADARIEAANVMVISMAYMERRAYATCVRPVGGPRQCPVRPPGLPASMSRWHAGCPGNSSVAVAACAPAGREVHTHRPRHAC
ncbi:ElyC/SanA/YdcF family protein [Actinopolymorpha sp. B11F2]|uniref:ElyC/SanA/YdcF family protein n=1 Tax=Actinopolymorpha sp. B11F2 TaxID=3160862 RepID=UPI0032E38B83